MHAEFEYIHPFQDGNGRVGRLVALKECLRHGVIPFIIEDAKKITITEVSPNGEMKRACLLIPAWTGRIHLKDLWICWKFSTDSDFKKLKYVLMKLLQ